MRVVIQRVSKASVDIEEREKNEIGKGLLVLCGFGEEDETEDLEWMARKIGDLRIFDDEEGKMNHSVNDIGGDILLVSQFTLHAKTKKGTRPSFIRAAKPDQAIPLYKKFILLMKANCKGELKTGEFGADMKVALVNDGPVTLWIDTKNKE